MLWSYYCRRKRSGSIQSEDFFLFFPSYIVSSPFTILSITTYRPTHKDVHTCNMHTCIRTYWRRLLHKDSKNYFKVCSLNKNPVIKQKEHLKIKLLCSLNTVLWLRIASALGKMWLFLFLHRSPSGLAAALMDMTDLQSSWLERKKITLYSW